MEASTPDDPIPPPIEEPAVPPATPAVPPAVIDVQAVTVRPVEAPSEPPVAPSPVGTGYSGPPIPPPILPERRASGRTWKQHAWAVLCHLMLFLVIPTVFLGAVITFFLWQVKGRRDPQVEDQGREALNFQINVAVLTALLGITFFGVALVPFVWLVAGIFCVIAARKAAEGVNYRYPYIWRVVTH